MNAILVDKETQFNVQYINNNASAVIPNAICVNCYGIDNTGVERSFQIFSAIVSSAGTRNAFNFNVPFEGKIYSMTASANSNWVTVTGKTYIVISLSKNGDNINLWERFISGYIGHSAYVKVLNWCFGIGDNEPYVGLS